MLTLVTRLRAVLLFYRSVAPFTLGISALIICGVLLPALQEGGAAGLLPMLVLVKVGTGPVVWYLSERTRPHQYWFYHNLGVSRRHLWAGVALLDGLLFVSAAAALSAVH